MSINRRGFVKASAIGAVALSTPFAGIPGGGVHAQEEAKSKPIDDIRVAVIGTGGRGGSHIDGMRKNVVAICDADYRAMERHNKSFDGKVETYQDFRKVLDRNDIDAVSIATPNHTHSYIGILAAMAGKDVYVEKPVSHHVWEGREFADAARKYGRMIQCGTQSRSSESLKDAVEFVRAGNLGAIQYAIGTCYKRRASIGKLDQPLKLPETLDYDLWCGPAAMVDIYRPKLHYDWHWDFNTGNGDMGNQGIHQMDIARWFLGESTISPKVLSIGGRLGYEDAGNTPNTQTVVHLYEKAPLIFETRGLPKSADSGDMDEYRGSRVGVIIQCEKGHVLVPSYEAAIAFDADGKEIKSWRGGGERIHFNNFLEAVASRDASILNAEVLEGHLSSALCHTGNVSHRMGKKATVGQIEEAIQALPLLQDSFRRMRDHLEANNVSLDGEVLTLGAMLEMDVATERVTNLDEANGLIRRDDRAPYLVPEIS
jgi:predicted dehydrogenase